MFDTVWPGSGLPEYSLVTPRYANMIAEVTNETMGLDDSMVPDECCLRQVKHVEDRCNQRVGDTTLFSFRRRVTGGIVVM